MATLSSLITVVGVDSGCISSVHCALSVRNKGSLVYKSCAESHLNETVALGNTF